MSWKENLIAQLSSFYLFFFPHKFSLSCHYGQHVYQAVAYDSDNNVILSRFSVSQFSYCIYFCGIPVETNKKVVQKIWEVSACVLGDHNTFDKIKRQSTVFYLGATLVLCVSLCLCNSSIEMPVLNSHLHTVIREDSSLEDRTVCVCILTIRKKGDGNI